jgi:hypothetical protein
MTSIAASTLVDVPLPLRVPRTPRELLRLLSLVGRFDDLDAWLGRLDLQQVTAAIHLPDWRRRSGRTGFRTTSCRMCWTPFPTSCARYTSISPAVPERI